ncbi:Zinc finger, U1-type, partial [Cynara cardunculus var. scolymus]
MQPTNPTLSDLYAHQRQHPTSQYYSHFPPQNPNPYPLHLHRQLQIESQISSAAMNLDPPASNTYFTTYSVNPAGGAYNAHHASGVTYSQTIGVAPPPAYAADLLVQNWPSEESVQQYANTLYATVGTVTQDGLQQLPSAIPTPSGWTNPTFLPRGPWKKLPKKTKIAQSAWCEICKIECNTKDVLYQHKLGKKHLKNLEKLNSVSSVATSSFIPHVHPAVPSNPIIGPPENPKLVNPVPKKKKAETPEDLEMKRRKVLEGGAAANAVRTCRICNVICNSDTVFRFHLAGQKHSFMLKKLQGAGMTGL